MKKFAITTISDSGDAYIYFIEHPKKPTQKQIQKFLFKNGCDVDDERCYENIDQIAEITEFFKLED